MSTSLRQLLRRSSYRQLWSAGTVSQWCDAFNTVALLLLVYSLNGSGLGVSGVVVAEILPVLRAALAFALPFVDGSVLPVYAIAVGLSTGAVFFDPAAQSVLPAIVGERELVAANSGQWTAAVISQIVLAPLAGVVVATLGYTWAFWISAGATGALLVVLGPRAPASRCRGLRTAPRSHRDRRRSRSAAAVQAHRRPAPPSWGPSRCPRPSTPSWPR